MELSTATAFWSYAHADNEATGGHVRALARQVAGAYQVEAGEALTLFVDRDETAGLNWGDEWEGKIRSTIAGTTFFIPIISPSYLNSTNCRNEFLEFWTRASSSDLGELLLPILYADVDLSDDTDDEICKIVKRIQFLDWRDVRLEDEGSNTYKKALAVMGRRLKKIAQDVELKPEKVPTQISSNLSNTDDEDSDPGLFELMEIAENAMADVDPNMAKINRSFGRIGEAFQSMPSLNSDVTMAERSKALKKLAFIISPPAKEFRTSSQALEDKLREIDTAMAAVVDFSKNPLLSSDENSPMQLAQSKFANVRNHIETDMVNAFPQYREIFKLVARMSRDMKTPVTDIQKGFQSLENSLNMISGWSSATDTK